jgi:hypothetical protein
MAWSSSDKSRLTAVLLCVGGVYVVWHFFFGVVAAICSEEVKGVFPSPDGRLTATVYVRGCGAAAHNITHVNVRKTGVSNDAALSGIIDSGKVYTSEGDPEMQVVWIDAGTIRIEARKSANAPGVSSNMQSSVVLSVGDQ